MGPKCSLIPFLEPAQLFFICVQACLVRVILMVSCEIDDASTTVGTPIAITGTPCFPRQPQPAVVANARARLYSVSVSCMVVLIRPARREAKASMAITAAGSTRSTSPRSISNVSTPVVPERLGLLPLPAAWVAYEFRQMLRNWRVTNVFSTTRGPSDPAYKAVSQPHNQYTFPTPPSGSRRASSPIAFRPFLTCRIALRERRRLNGDIPAMVYPALGSIYFLHLNTRYGRVSMFSSCSETPAISGLISRASRARSYNIPGFDHPDAPSIHPLLDAV